MSNRDHRAYSQIAKPRDGHLRDSELSSLLAYELSPADRQEVAEHIHHCSECEDALCGAQSVLEGSKDF